MRYVSSTTVKYNQKKALAFSTTEIGRHDIAEILLKVALKTKNSNSNSYKWSVICILSIYMEQHLRMEYISLMIFQSLWSLSCFH
jgi:hypothetical protein